VDRWVVVGTFDVPFNFIRGCLFVSDYFSQLFVRHCDCLLVILVAFPHDFCAEGVILDGACREANELEDLNSSEF
jgi:hypothetical protein